MSFAIELARVFSASKTIESPILNSLGVQPLRAIFARGIYRARRDHCSGPADEFWVRALRADGIVAIHPFLPEEQFARLRAEAEIVLSHPGGFKLHQRGPTEVWHHHLRDLNEQEFPELNRWRHHNRALNLVAAAAKRSIEPEDGLRVLERISYTDNEDVDPEINLHVDTFFHTHKLWLYLDDVRMENGPFTYVPRSHRLSATRLRRDYREARTTNAGSRRIGEEEIEQRGLQRELLMCPANTLLIADTCGYHCRTLGVPGHSRRALHMSFRFNPFMPVWLKADTRLTRRNPRLARILQTLEGTST